ncbi:MAG: hypothetical protein OQK82_02380, partial [Candidatus Pacearchaeota archaeon]|nr:hypothetical protein [Candidatus Pacearchaeota archaeon]
NPWSIHFSRIAHEASLGPFFYFLLLYLYYDLLHASKKSKSWIIAGIVLGISFYTYQASWLMNPLLILLMGVIFYKETKKKYKQLFLSLAIGFVLFFPILSTHFLFPEPGMESRLSEVSIFNYPDAIVKIIENYFYYFSPDFLLLKGDELVFTFPGNARLYGEFHLYLIVLLVPSVLLLILHSIQQKTLRREILLLLGLVILYPIPASLTNPSGWALRGYTVFPAFHIIAGLGLMWFLFRFKQISEKKMLQVATSLIIAGVVLFQSVFFLYNYYTKYPKQPSNYLSYHYGIKESVQYIQTHKEKYDKIFISGRINQPFIYILFYTSYDPVKYHSIKKIIDPTHWGWVYEFEKYVFIDEEQMPLGRKGSLFMVSGSPPIKGNKPLHQVMSPDESRILFTIWEF